MTRPRSPSGRPYRSCPVPGFRDRWPPAAGANSKRTGRPVFVSRRPAHLARRGPGHAQFRVGAGQYLHQRTSRPGNAGRSAHCWRHGQCTGARSAVKRGRTTGKTAPWAGRTQGPVPGNGLARTQDTFGHDPRRARPSRPHVTSRVGVGVLPEDGHSMANGVERLEPLIAHVLDLTAHGCR